jgi:hypothetical protein
MLLYKDSSKDNKLLAYFLKVRIFLIVGFLSARYEKRPSFCTTKNVLLFSCPMGL